MDPADEARVLTLRLSKAERERDAFANKAALLESSLKVARHGATEAREEARKFRKALQLAEAELAGAAVAVACGSEGGAEAVSRAQAIIAAALGDPE